MTRVKYPVTAAIRMLRTHNVDYVPHLYKYISGGGAQRGADELGISAHEVIKTLVMVDELQKPLVVLMHGDLEVSTRELARQIGVKHIAPCDPKVAERITGYQVGGTSPFGMHREIPVYIESSILELPQIYINGGRRGFLVLLKSAQLQQILRPIAVTVAR